jgi:hypothetical protein
MTDESPASTDSQVHFQLWRRLMGGDLPDSNMRLLDAALQKLDAQIELLRAMSAGGSSYYVRTTGDDPHALQVAPDSITPTASQVCIGEVSIVDIAVGDYVRLVTINPDGTAELLDIRNGLNGMIHSSAGNAVRALEAAIAEMRTGVNIVRNRPKICIDNPAGELTLLPDTRYILSGLPTVLPFVLDDTHAAPEMSQEFNFVILPQSNPYTLTASYFSGLLEIVWPENLTFDPGRFYDVRIADGVVVVSGDYITFEALQAIENAIAVEVERASNEEASIRAKIITPAERAKLEGIEAGAQQNVPNQDLVLRRMLFSGTGPPFAMTTADAAYNGTSGQVLEVIDPTTWLNTVQLWLLNTLADKLGKDFSESIGGKLLYGLAINAIAQTNVVQIAGAHLHPLSGAVSMQNVNLPLVSENNAGLMPRETYQDHVAMVTRVSALEGQRRLFYARLGTGTPSAAQLTAVVTGASAALADGVTVVELDCNKEYTWFAQNASWVDRGSATVMPFTNASSGTLRGKNEFGYVFAENGYGAVVGMDGLLTAAVNNAEDILLEKQRALAAEASLRNAIPSTPAQIGAQPAGSYATSAQLSALQMQVNGTPSYTAPTSGPLAGLSLTNAVAYLNQLLNGEHKNITLDVNTVKVPLN